MTVPLSVSVSNECERSDVISGGIEVKVKVTLQQATKAQTGNKFITLHFLYPRRFKGVGWSTPSPRRVTRRKDLVPIVWVAG